MTASGTDAAPIRLLVSGATGRMGRTIAKLAAQTPRFSLIGGLDREGELSDSGGFPRILTIEESAELITSADVLVDFSAPAFLRRILVERRRELEGKALVIGTTGLGPDEEGEIARAAMSAPVLAATNFSLGVALLTALVERTAAALPPSYDVEIVEAHHRRKEDAPSGTALTLGEAAAGGRGVRLSDVKRDGRSGRPGARPAGEIGFHAVRGGDIVGEHQVLFIGDHDRIELIHRAADRALFAEGALSAALWIADRSPGRYTMRDVLGL